MSRSTFDSFNIFIRRNRRWIIIAWILALVISVTFIPSFFSAVSYNIANESLSGPKNTQSQISQNILNAQFPSSNNSSQNSILLVIQPTDGNNVYSGSIRDSILALNKTISSDSNQANYTGVSTIYSTEYGLLNSTVPGFLSGVSILASNLTTINKSLYVLQQNLSSLSTSIFKLKQGINQTSQLVYGIPTSFVAAWTGFVNGGQNTTQADASANSTVYTNVASPQGSEALGYYKLFYQNWIQLSNITSPLVREDTAVNSTATNFVQSPSVNNASRALILSVAQGLNATSWNQDSAITNLTLSSISSQIPQSLSSTLGITPSDLVTSLYNLGPAPTTTELGNLTIQLVTNSFSNSTTSPSTGFSLHDLISSAYALGTSPSTSATWAVASKFFSNATESTFSTSPLFTINSTSLANLLAGFTNSTTTSSEIQDAIQNMAYNQSISSYPLVLSKSLTQNFISPNNSTMLALFNYSFPPSSLAISSFQKSVNSSDINTLSTTYVTGGVVVSQDLSKVFSPALEVTIVAGVIVSIIIVGLLFLAPLAALVPLLLGGLSIVIAYAAIYLGITKIQHAQLNFLTPTLTSLLMLGLAVDYSVLQLRRTREERMNGKTKEESVAISVRWAGEAVLTAGITVIVAYIVMAGANVPIFSDVGTAIAIGVSILLAVSLTLLPSLELAMGDRLFWPGLRARKKQTKPGMLERISDKTLRHKVAIAIVISLFAAGAVYSTYSTPTGLDFLKLIPNFPSNQGLTVLTNNFGSGTVAPVTILVVTPTPIVNGHNQFNQTLLNEIELISSKAAGSPDVTSVTGPTRPFGSTFNYTTIQNMTEPLRSQYLSGMISDIGKNNETALILVGLNSSSESAQGVSSLLQLESNVNSLTLQPNTQVYYGGNTQATYDSQSFINSILPEVIIILAAAVYVILMIQLRSAFTPLRLVFTILCSVAFALSFLSIVFDHILSLPIFDFAPLFVVVTMLGVGIDYDIFYVTRIREEVLKGKSDSEAIKTATSKIWVTIFGLGLVLSSVFGSLLITDIAMLQEISLAVSAAVLIDISVVILFFVPSLMGMAERFNWWPSKLNRSRVGNNNNNKKEN